MPDWPALVHRHLASARVDARRRQEIGAELAAHLEDAYDGALRRGSTETEAMACAMALVPSWRALAVAMDESADEASIMTRPARTILLPGTAILVAAAMGQAFVVYSMSAERWLDPRWQAHAFAAGLYFLFYLALGAAGAAWSRHLGGSPGERLAAGVFPLLLHLAVAGPAAGADLLYALSQGAGGVHLGMNMRNMFVLMFVAPGAALLLGVLPFARGETRLDAQ